MAMPDRPLAEELFASRRPPAPAGPPPNDDTAARAHARSRAEPQGGDQEEEDGPDFRGAYRAFGRPRPYALPALVIYFNAAERRKFGRKKVQVQYEHLDSDDPASEGLAEDGQCFSFVVAVLAA